MSTQSINTNTNATITYEIHKNYDLIQEERINQVNLLIPNQEIEIASQIHTIKLYSEEEKEEELNDEKEEEMMTITMEGKEVPSSEKGSDEKEMYKNVDHLFVLNELLHSDECQQILSIEKKYKHQVANSSSSSAGFESIQGEYPPEYRNSTRIVYNDKELAQILWRRMKKHLLRFTFVRPYGLDNGGHWIPIGVNECFRLSKYEPNQYFKPHVDGQFVRNADERSVYTLLIYLNDDFSGGETKFLTVVNNGEEVATQSKPKKLSRSDKKMAKKKFAKEATKLNRFTPEIDLKKKSMQFKYLCSVSPKIGSAAIFNHDLYHEGCPINSGIKYILRTEIMFKRVDSNSNVKTKDETKLYNQVMTILKQSDDLERKGKIYESTDYYRKVQDLLIMNGHSMSLLMVPKFNNKSNISENTSESYDNELSILPDETINHILSYLQDWEICQLILPLDRYFHFFGRNNQLWESLYMHRWGNHITDLMKRLYQKKNSEISQINSSDNTTSIDETPNENEQDWYHIYIMKRYFEKEFEPVFLDIGFDRSNLSSIDGVFKNVSSMMHRPKFSHYSVSRFSSYRLVESKGHARIKPLSATEINPTFNVFVVLLLSELKKTPQRHPVVLSLSSILMKNYKVSEAKIKDKLFKTNIPAISILPRCYLLSIYYGLRTCLVIDINQVCLSVHAIVESDMKKIESVYFEFPRVMEAFEIGPMIFSEDIVNAAVSTDFSFDKCKMVSMIDQILGQYSNEIRFKLSENIILSGEVIEDKKQFLDIHKDIRTRFSSGYSRYKIKFTTEGPEAVKGAISFSKLPNFKDYFSYWFNCVDTLDRNSTI